MCQNWKMQKQLIKVLMASFKSTTRTYIINICIMIWYGNTYDGYGT